MGLNIGDSTLALFAANSPLVKELNLDDCCEVEDEGVCAIVQKLKFLTVLSLSECNITDLAMYAVAENCPLLQTLTINYCKEVTELSLLTVCDRCPQLSTVWFNNSGIKSGSVFEYMARNCEALYFNNLPGIPGMITKYAHNIMRISNCVMLFTHGYDISVNSFKVMAHFAPRLQVLSIAGVYNITDAIVAGMMEKCPFIHTLELAQRGSVALGNLTKTLQKCHNIVKLTITKLTSLNDESLIQYLNAKPNQLKYLDMSECLNITDKSLKQLANACPDLTSLVCNENPAVTDDGITAVVKGCTQLARLDVSNCPKLTNKVLIAIMRYGNNVQKLNITGCGLITTNEVYRFLVCNPLKDFNSKL